MLPVYFPPPGSLQHQVCWVGHARLAPVHGRGMRAADQSARTLSGADCLVRLRAPYGPGAAKGLLRWLDCCRGRPGNAGRHQPPLLLVGRGAQGPAWPRPRSACSARAPASSAPGLRAPHAARPPQLRDADRPLPSRQRRPPADRHARCRRTRPALGRAQLAWPAHARQLRQPHVPCRARWAQRRSAPGCLRQARPVRTRACSAGRGRGAAPALGPRPR